MSLSLESLSPLLSQQFSELPYGNHQSTKNFVLNVENIPIDVKVMMKQTENWAPETEIVWQGRAFTHTAYIEISPSNAKVIQAVANHFKAQIWDRFEKSEPLFDSVLINGLRL